jgi:hypothetical protein
MLSFCGHPIYIATKVIQRRKHHKKRINKKWRKKYGCYEINRMPFGQVIMMDDGVIWMTKKTFELLRKGGIKHGYLPVCRGVPIRKETK